MNIFLIIVFLLSVHIPLHLQVKMIFNNHYRNEHHNRNRDFLHVPQHPSVDTSQACSWPYMRKCHGLKKNILTCILCENDLEHKTNLDQEYYFIFFSYCFTVRWNKRGRHTGTWSFQFIFSWILLQQMVKHTVLSKHSFPFKDLTAQHGDICWVEEGQNPCQSLLHRCENLVCKKQTCTCYTGGKNYIFSWGHFC